MCYLLHFQETHASFLQGPGSDNAKIHPDELLIIFYYTTIGRNTMAQQL